MSRARRAVLAVALVCVLLAGFALWWAERAFFGPGPLTEDTTLVIARGAGLAGIAATLEQAGVVADARIFVAGARLTGRDRRLRAGEFRFPRAVSMAGAADVLISGELVQRRLTIAEGLTTAQALALIDAAEGLEGAIDDPPGEGELLPETYFYVWGEQRADVLARMRRAMDEALESLWAGRSPDIDLPSKHAALVLASIVEKETSVPEERARIAAVFHNRLRRGMRLQSDPTVVYALTGGEGALGRALTRADLRLESPYNTYFADGLPPGAIANPGRASIAATLNPAETDELYFVADGSGGHVFARTLAEHNRNVARWRRIRDGGE